VGRRRLARALAVKARAAMQEGRPSHRNLLDLVGRFEVSWPRPPKAREATERGEGVLWRRRYLLCLIVFYLLLWSIAECQRIAIEEHFLYVWVVHFFIC
jgi:hypothetical protein